MLQDPWSGRERKDSWNQTAAQSGPWDIDSCKVSKSILPAKVTSEYRRLHLSTEGLCGTTPPFSMALGILAKHTFLIRNLRLVLGRVYSDKVKQISEVSKNPVWMDRKMLSFSWAVPRPSTLFLLSWFWLPGNIWNRIRKTLRVRSKNFMVFEKEVAGPRVQNFWDGALDSDFYCLHGAGLRGLGPWQWNKRHKGTSILESVALTDYLQLRTLS